MRALTAFRDFASDPPGYLERLAASHGLVSRFPMGPRESFVLVTDPAAIDTVLRDASHEFRKDGMTRALGEIVGRGLLTSEGEPWREHRKQLAPLFRRENVEGHADTILRRAREYAASLRTGEIRDVHADMQRLTVRVVGEALLGLDIGEEADVLTSSLDVTLTSFQRLMQTWRRLVPGRVPLRDRRRIARARVALDGALGRLLDDPRTGRAGTVPALMRDGRGAPGSRVELRDEVATLLLAGHETTASALAFTLWLLARHADVAGRLQRDLLAPPASGAPAGQLVRRVPLLRAVVQESLRLFPPAWILGREALEDCRVCGFRVLRGEELVMSPWVMQRDPRWFVDPAAFRPERWLDGLEERLPRHVYFPFGGGARACIGSHFALLEVQVVLATVLRDWSVEPLDDTPLELLPSITLRPKHGVRLRLSRRV
ncbi:MAG: cytochrome P450 [Myxococcales bacterium]|nr:cytochrome P450 [Myxococcales bacterium]